MRSRHRSPPWLIFLCLCLFLVSLPAGPVAYRALASPPAPARHGMGLIWHGPLLHAPLRRPRIVPIGLPASVDLSAYLPPVGDQGPVGSCASWAVGYTMRGWYAIRDGYYPRGPDALGGYSAMFLYSQIARGNDQGSSLEAPAQLMVEQGIDTRADYSQGDFDYTSQPTAAEVANAAPGRVAGYSTVWSQGSGQDYRSAAEAALAAGEPVWIAVSVFQVFEMASASNPVIGAVPPGAQPIGGHAVAVYGYDARGLLFQNSWGAGWAAGGRAVLSWAYLDTALLQVEHLQVVPVTPPAPTPPPAPATALPTLPATVVPPPTYVPPPPLATATTAPHGTVQPTPTPGGTLSWPWWPANLPHGTYTLRMTLIDSTGRLRAQSSITVVR